MTKSSPSGVSRRSVLRFGFSSVGIGAAILGITAIGTIPSAAATDEIAADSAPSKADQDSSDKFKSLFRPNTFTNLSGIHAEYLAAVSLFPYALPNGESFPRESSLKDPVPGAQWECGSGAAEVYLYWQTRTVAASSVAYSRRDAKSSQQLLSVLDTAYSSQIRAAIIEDADGHLKLAIDEARRGSFDQLSLLTSLR